MRRGTFIIWLTNVACAFNWTLKLHEQHDQPEFIGLSFYRHRVDAAHILPIRIALKQSENALDHAEAWLMDVSDPRSPRYGKHWSRKEVEAAFQPADDTVDIVREWLSREGIAGAEQTDNKQWLVVQLSTSRAETLLHTEFYYNGLTSSNSDADLAEVFCDYYYLPDTVSSNVDFVLPGVQRQSQPDRNAQVLSRRDVQQDILHKAKASTQPHDLPKYTLKHCSKYVTPACVRAMYGIPPANLSQAVNPNNTIGVVEFQDGLFWQPDLDRFYTRFTNIPNGTAPINIQVNDALPPLGSTPHPNNTLISSETSLDIEWTQSIVYPQNVSIYQVAGERHLLTIALPRFLDAIDGSFCLPSQRKSNAEGRGPQCGAYKPPNVISISYGTDETYFSKFWSKRACIEILKLGMQGVSVFFGSGDTGVSVIPQSVKNGTFFQCPKDGVLEGVFGPTFPASCPWATAVGGTVLPKNGSAFDREISSVLTYFDNATHKIELLGSSGGGFSNRWERPSYQDAVVEEFFASHDPPYLFYTNGHWRNSTGIYNRNGRGFPDIAATSKHMAYCYNDPILCPEGFGTSWASPIAASMFNLIIEERLRIGKGPLGFLNPVLYQNSHAFTDILQGQNGYCKISQGFRCVPGWDPVTGLGTPKYKELLDVFLNLP